MTEYLTMSHGGTPLMNHIYPREYWDESAVSDPYSAILSNFDEKQFWGMKVNVDGLNKDTVFLDLGCGIGRLARHVGPIVEDYFGVDFSPEMIKKAKSIFRDNLNVHFYINNGIDLLEFGSNLFDVVYVELVFQHMQKEITFNYIREVYRVLKKGGIFYANNIPTIGKYIGGLTTEELDKAISPFQVLEKKEEEFYYKCKLKK